MAEWKFKNFAIGNITDRQNWCKASFRYFIQQAHILARNLTNVKNSKVALPSTVTAMLRYMKALYRSI